MLERIFPFGREKVDKKKIWEKSVKELDFIADRLGMPIDENIKEAVVGMNLNGLPTTGSCGGHTGERYNFPYLMGQADGEPEYRFINEAEIIKKLSGDSTLPVGEIRRNIYMDGDSGIGKIFWDYIKENDAKETDEYINWGNQNDLLEEKAKDLIEEFYKEKGVGVERIIHISPISDAYYIDTNTVDDIHPSKIDKDIANKKITEAQKEMQEFTTFLKNKFFKK